MINEKIPAHQSGFREYHSTTQQCHRIINEILKGLEEKQLCTAAFLDIQQAFDRVWHDSLLFKLKATLPTPYYLLLQSHLTDRYSQIKFNTATSVNFPIHSGVPQRSVLGPLFYLIFTADIPTRNDTTIATFADDTAILASNEDPQTASQSLQTHLNHLATWLNIWRIKVKETKSVHVTFTNRRIDCPIVTINGTQLPVQTEVKCLGLLLDQKFTWRPHITAKNKQIYHKLRKLHWLIGRKSKLTTENKLLLYKVILKPIWTYGAPLWSCYKPSKTNIIQRIRSKILRVVFNAPRYVSNKTLHESSGIPFVEKEIKRITNKNLQNLSDHSNKQISELKPLPKG